MVWREALQCEVAPFRRFKRKRLGLAGESKLFDAKAVVHQAAMPQQLSQQHGVVVRIGQQDQRGIEQQQPVENPLPRCATGQLLALPEGRQNVLLDPGGTGRLVPAVGEFEVQRGTVVCQQTDRQQARVGGQAGEFGIEKDVHGVVKNSHIGKCLIEASHDQGTRSSRIQSWRTKGDRA